MKHARDAFTLVELLVVIGIIMILMSIIIPAFNAARRQANTIIKINNEHIVVSSISMYANDYKDRFPPNINLKGSPIFNSVDFDIPTVLVLTQTVGNYSRETRALKTYLGSYIENSSVIVNPKSPTPQYDMDEIWELGEDWEFTSESKSKGVSDPLFGTFAFYWNYDCIDAYSNKLLYGPKNTASRRGEHKILISDTFFYDHWIPSEKISDAIYFTSSEEFENGSSGDNENTLAHWATYSDTFEPPNVNLHAGFVDGHVEQYNPTDDTFFTTIDRSGLPFGGNYIPKFYIPTHLN